MMATVIAFMEIRIGQNSLTGNIVKRDVLSGKFRRRSDNERVCNAFRQRNRPLQCLHTAQAAADNGRPFLNAEVIGKHGLGLHPVFDGYDRKIRAVFVAGFRIFRQRAGAAVATAQVVQTDNEKAFGIDGFAGADHIVPPAGVFILRTVLAGNVMIA